MAINPLPAAPNRATDNAAAFSTKADALLGALAGFVSEANALAAGLQSIAAGGAMTLAYTFSTATADADPGAGFLRLGNATQNLATVLRVDDTDATGVNWGAFLATLAASSSTIKGQIRLANVADASKWLLFDVTALASPAGYRNITVTPIASSAASPFINGDSLILYFTRTGDKGNVGSAGLSAPLATLTPTAVANVDALSVFSAGYDNYLIVGSGLKPAVADVLVMKAASAGAVDAANNFASSGNSFFNIVNLCGSAIGPTGKGANFVIHVTNANDATSVKGITGQGASHMDSTQGFQTVTIMSNYQGGAMSGLRLCWNAGNNFAAQGKVRVYGYNNT